MKLTCIDIDQNGYGIAKSGSEVISVYNFVPGEISLVKLLYRKSSIWKGIKIRNFIGSDNRQDPPCNYSSECGGCTIQHLTYQAQIKYKYKNLCEVMKRIGKVDINPNPVLFDTGLSFGYRNRAILPISRDVEGLIRMGYYKVNSHIIVPIDSCNVLDNRINEKILIIKKDIEKTNISASPDNMKQKGLRHIAIRIAPKSGEILITLVSSLYDPKVYKALAQKWYRAWDSVVGVTLNINQTSGNKIFGSKSLALVGRNNIVEQFFGLNFTINSLSFFQINYSQAERVANLLVNWAHKNCRELKVIDAYCGIGTFSLPLASIGFQVIGIEVSKECIQNANENLILNSISNCRFIYGSVDCYLDQYLDNDSLLLLDPPRKGLDRSVINIILDKRPRRIAYLSCSPGTLARDLELLVNSSTLYKIDFVQPFDFFPQTTHLECLVFLSTTNS